MSKTPKYLPSPDAHDQLHAEAAIRYGFYALACAVEGLDPDATHDSSVFSSKNPYVHQAVRNGDILAKYTNSLDKFGRPEVNEITQEFVQVVAFKD